MNSSTALAQASLRQYDAPVNQSLLRATRVSIDAALGRVATLQVGLATGLVNGLLLILAALLALHCMCTGGVPAQRPRHTYSSMPLVGVEASTFSFPR